MATEHRPFAVTGSEAHATLLSEQIGPISRSQGAFRGELCGCACVCLCRLCLQLSKIRLLVCTVEAVQEFKLIELLSSPKSS